ncbi:hypothetical protein GW17_00021691 [Ensete ventricosum]|nr:hypothetical protein GW17_00021691 [Ensete ventricosum]
MPDHHTSNGKQPNQQGYHVGRHPGLHEMPPPPSAKPSSALEELQAMVVVQVPAPELLVVLLVGVRPVHGPIPVADELLRGVDHHAVAGAEERRHRYPLPVRVYHRSMPHAPVPSVTQCLHQRRYVTFFSINNWKKKKRASFFSINNWKKKKKKRASTNMVKSSWASATAHLFNQQLISCMEPKQPRIRKPFYISLF